MIQNISNDRLIERIAAKAIKLNYEYCMNVENDLYNALYGIEAASSTGDDEDLGTNLYWLLIGTATESRLRSFANIRIGGKQINVNDCEYFPHRFLGATFGMRIDNGEVYPALISDAKPGICVEIDDPNSLQSVGEAYATLMNKVMDYYEGLKTMYVYSEYMKSLLDILKKKNPDADWEHFSPRRIIDEIKNI